MPLFVERNLFGQLGHEMRTFRTWANEAHLALQNVPELRNLVHANLANDAAHARRAGIAFLRPYGSILLGIDSHGPELCQHKRATVLSDSVLRVKDRPG